MKNLKRMFSLLLSIVMVLGVSVSALAASTITVRNAKSNHTYEAYQIFSGTLSEDNTLTQIVWGLGIDTAKLPADYPAADVKAASLTEDNKDAFAKEIVSYLSTNVAGTATSANNVISNLTDGYYLIKDKDNSLSGNDAYTASILMVAGNAEVDLKTSIPIVEKKVQDKNTSTSEETGWQDSADYAVNDVVPFQLTATLGDNVTLYNAYEIMFVDTLSKGLDYNKGSVTVKVNDTDITNYCTVESSKDASTGETTLKIYCADVLYFNADAGSEIVAEYKATLNGDSVIGSLGNPNEVYLTYSNNPNVEYKGLPDEDNDGTPDEPTKPTDGDEPNGSGDVPTTPTGSDTPENNGKTKEDGVVVYTYELDVNKVILNSDGQYESRNGATFALYKLTPKADGSYDETLVEQIDGSDKSTFEFKRIDDGIYKLVEVTPPSGYNSIEPIQFEVKAEHTVDADLNSIALIRLTGNADGKIDITSNEGILTTQILNQKGSNLPSTGGMGTKLFYIFGGLLVLAASVLLITRRRMSND